MKHVLKSDVLTVEINFHGAEISSIKSVDGLEYIWQADQKIWPRHAPVLFPIVGKLRNNQYSFEGINYTMGQHGFARDMEFKSIHGDGKRCTFQLSSSVITKKNYPFDFEFLITYSLEANSLTTNYDIINTGEEQLPASVGAHPGFRCPLLPGEKFEDYYLQFGQDKLKTTPLNDGLRAARSPQLIVNEGILNLDGHLFDNDALVFENGQVRQITLKSRKSSHKVEMSSEDWPYFGVWSKKGCKEFICLEPWYGIADKEDATGQILEKEGMIHLNPGERFSCNFKILIS